MKSLALGLGALVLLAVSFWLFAAKSPTPSGSVGPSKSAELEVEGRSEPHLGSSEETSMTLDTETDGDSRSGREAPIGTIGPKLTRFFGTLDCVDENDQPVNAPDATLAFTIASHTHTVAVTDGRFEGELVGDASTPIKLESVQIPRVQVALDPNAQELALDGQAWTIKAWILPRISLHVRDAATGAELDRVRLATDLDNFAESLPGLEEGLETGMFLSSSPIELSPLPEELEACRGMLLVSAAGYAWTRFRFDRKHSGELTVELEPGADVIVETRLPPLSSDERLQLALAKIGQGAEGPGRTRLRLTRKEEPQAGQYAEVFDLEDGRQASRFRGLIPGLYRIDLHQTRAAESWAITHLDVHLEAGPNARVVLEAASLEPPALQADGGAPVTIHLILPGAWGELTEAPELKLTSRVDGEAPSIFNFEREREGPETWRFANEHVPPGTYSLTGENPQVMQQLEVPPGGLETRLELPRACTITLRVIDAVTGEPDPVGPLRFYTKWNQDKPAYISGDTSPGSSPGELTAIVPTGTTFFIPGSGKPFIQNTIEVHADGQVFVLETIEPIPVEVFLESGGQALSQTSMEDALSNLVFDGPGRLTSIPLDGSIYEAKLTQPGTYIVSLQGAKLFLDTTPMEVEITGDKIARINIKLEAR